MMVTKGCHDDPIQSPINQLAMGLLWYLCIMWDLDHTHIYDSARFMDVLPYLSHMLISISMGSYQRVSWGKISHQG